MIYLFDNNYSNNVSFKKLIIQESIDDVLDQFE